MADLNDGLDAVIAEIYEGLGDHRGLIARANLLDVERSEASRLADLEIIIERIRDLINTVPESGATHKCDDVCHLKRAQCLANLTADILNETE